MSEGQALRWVYLLGKTVQVGSFQDGRLMDCARERACPPPPPPPPPHPPPCFSNERHEDKHTALQSPRTLALKRALEIFVDLDAH